MRIKTYKSDNDPPILQNMDFIENKYTDIQGEEGLYLAIESLKSLITNDEYRKLLDASQINNILVDYFSCTRTNPFNIYFTSFKVAKKAIEAVGEDRIKKYYFDVEK